MKRAISRQELLTVGKLLGASALVAVIYPPVAGLDYTARALSDALSIAGLVLLIVGLFRLVCRMGQFDSTRYGFRKFIEVIRTKDYVHSKSQLPSLAQYKAEHPYRKKYLPVLAAAAVDLLLALLLA